MQFPSIGFPESSLFNDLRRPAGKKSFLPPHRPKCRSRARPLYPCDTAKIPRHSDFCKQIFISDDWGRFFTIAAQGRTLDSWRGSGSFARLPSGRDPNESRRSRTIQSPSEGKRAFRLQGLPRLLPAIRLPAWRAQSGETACRGLSGADRAAGVEAGELKGRAGANKAESGLNSGQASGPRDLT